MTATSKKASFVRLFALIAVLAMVAAACTSGGDTTTTTGGEAPTTTEGGGTDTTMSTETTAPGTTEPPSTGGDLGTYTLGIFQDVTTDNVWNMIDTAGNTVWNSYFLTPTTATPYTVALPGLELQPLLAEPLVPGDRDPQGGVALNPAVQEGDVWVGEFTFREGLLWSDGEAITAEDFAFTWNAAVDTALIGNWQDYTDAATAEGGGIVTSVEAVDDLTVRVTFNAQPGLATWGPGTGVPLMPVMPEHYWAPIVEEALATESPRDTLLAASGADAPAAGGTMFADRQEGSFAAAAPNPNYFDQGAELTSGGVTWVEGPFAEAFQYPLYGGQEAAVLALADGEVDLLLNPLGMQRGFQDQVQGNEDLTAIVNPTNGYRFMAFNHSRAPMSDQAFRDALSILIDKEFVTGSLLQGVAFPLYVILPEGNEAWYNAEVAAELAEAQGAGMETADRQREAIRILTEAGYTWESAPAVADDGTFTAGSGLIGPDGTAIEQLELITPTASYDPLRATFANYISGVALEMGIPIVAIPTDFGKIVDDVFTFDEEAGVYTSPFDMFILGYSLGNPAFPTFHGSFFATNASDNNTQYSNEEYDAASAAFDSAQSLEEAYDAMWEMERLIARDKPHVPLFDTGILEFYNNRVEFPFTESLSGLQFIFGVPTAVAAK